MQESAEGPVIMPPPCPFLPDIGGERLPAAALAAFRHGSRGADFYVQALRCAQSRWLECLPAQALLMVNRAMGAELLVPDNALTLEDHPLPYHAVAWILRRGEEFGFLGNPRRHYQHLATRMSGGNVQRRQARAWACWYLAKTVNPTWEADTVQLEHEQLTEPTIEEIQAALARHGLPGEVAVWGRAVVSSRKLKP